MNKKFFTLLTTAALLLTNSIPFAATENSDEIEYFHPSDSVLTSSVVVSEDNASTYSWGNNEYLTVNVSLNNNALDQEISSFEITDVNGIENESIIEQDGKSVTISGLTENELYVFESVLISENASSSVRGGIEIVEDEQGELVAVTDVYDFSDLEMVATNDAAGIMPTSSGSVALYTESNDIGSTPADIHEDWIMRGVVHGSADKDLYKFTAVNSGIIDFKLLVPEGSNMNLTMTIYKTVSGTNTMVRRSDNLRTLDEFARVTNVNAGDVYRIEIEAVSGSSGNYYLQVENNPAKAWFPQSVGKIGSTYYWNTNNLDSLKYNGTTTFTDNNPGGEDGMALGCSISSFAMILANMGAKTISTKYDFRLSNYSKENQMQYLIGNLTPDPYIVFLVNNNATGNNISYNNGEYILSGSYTMNIASWLNIPNGFGVNDGTDGLGVGKLSINESSYTYNNFTSLKNRLDSISSSYYNHGVLMRFYKPYIDENGNPKTSEHTVVVTKESGVYKVYDPGQPNIAFYGKNLEDYLNNGGNPKGYNYEHILWIRYIY